MLTLSINPCLMITLSPLEGAVFSTTVHAIRVLLITTVLTSTDVAVTVSLMIPVLIQAAMQHESGQLRDLEDLTFLQHSLLHARNDRWDHIDLDWLQHVTQFPHKGTFENKYYLFKHKTNFCTSLTPF